MKGTYETRKLPRRSATLVKILTDFISELFSNENLKRKDSLMLTQNTNIKFQGFHPSEFTKTYLGEKINLLQNEAPIGATLKAAFTRNNNMIKGVVSVYSSAGRFFAVASGKN
jgi:hypothetical protein